MSNNEIFLLIFCLITNFLYFIIVQYLLSKLNIKEGE